MGRERERDRFEDKDLGSGHDGSEVAIIGMACRFPSASTVEKLWRLLRDGVESLTELSDEELRAAGVPEERIADPTYVRRASVIDGIEDFDASFFGYTPLEATIMDPQQRLFLECAWEVFEQAGYDPARYPRPVGVFTGAKTNTYLFNVVAQRARFPLLDNFQIALGNDLAAMATRVSYKLDLHGPSYALHTACSTSLVAVHLACQSLLLDECSMAVAGGAAINVPQRTGYPYQKGGILSPDGSCRTFDAGAAGSNFGNGVGAVLLKRLEDALADGDHVWAVIRGSATNNDGAQKASFTAPGVDGQTAVLLEAMAAAGVEAEDISYVEAHGTATDLGDSIEMLALTQAFRASTERRGFCAIGSAKTNLGHLETAAGVAGLIKTALALRYRELPPSLNFERPNPKIDFASSPFVVNTARREWPAPAAGKKRVAGVSSFGIGSTNAHVILEEPPPPPAADADRPWQALLLSARTETALTALSRNLGRHLAAAGDDLALADVAYTLALGRRGFEHRRVLVCRDCEAAIAALAGEEPAAGRHAARVEAGDRRVAFLFPGLGEHYVDMGVGLYQREPVFRDAVARCARGLEPLLGLDLRTVLYPRGTATAQRSGDGRVDLKAMLGRGGPVIDEAGARLSRTELVQPATFVIEYALAQLFMSRGVVPQAMIGYSLGEYVCACIAGVLALDDALTLVARRAALIGRRPAGAMLAVTLSEKEIGPWLAEHGLSLAAVNGTTGCVAAGPEAAVAELETALAAHGVMSRRLETSHAFHSTMLAEVADELTELARTLTLSPPQIPYVSNVTGTWIRAEEATDPGYWARHMCAPVRYADGVGELLAADGERALLEAGPGQSLTSFTRLHPRCGKDQPVVASMRSRHQGGSDAAAFLDALGALWLTGVEIDWTAHYAGERRRRVPLPTYPFERQRHWIDPDERTLAGTAGHAVATAESARVAPASVAPVKSPHLDEWLYRPAWTSRPWPEDPAGKTAAELWLVFADAIGVADELIAGLESRSGEVVRVVPGDGFTRENAGRFRLRPDRVEDYEELLAHLAGRQRLARVVHLWNVAPVPATPGDGQRFRDAQKMGFYSLIALVQALSRHKAVSGLEIDVAMSGVQDVHRDEALAAERSTLLGPCVVIPQEHPQIVCRAIDVDLPPGANGDAGRVDVRRVARRLAAELGAPADDLVVAHRGAERLVRSFERMPMPPVGEGASFREGGVYLITGGLGGIGLALAERLAREHRARLVLTRRTPLPPRETWDALAGHGEDARTRRAIEQVRALEAAGAEVMAVAADVADEEAMRAVVDGAVERFGAIHGVIHAAGVLTEGSFKTVALTGRDECELHFGPKVYGLYVLERVLAGIDLDFVTLYSSLSAILGGLGYVGYATANLFMDFFAARCNRDAAPGAVRWQSVDWDSWHYEEDESVRGGLGTTLSALAMTPSEGFETLRRILTVAEPRHLVISTGELQPRLDQWVALRTLRAASASASAGATRARRTATGLATDAEREAEIAAIWCRILGTGEVGREENFFDLGGNSLLGMQLVAELTRELGVEVEPVALFESPTVAAMARFLGPDTAADEAPRMRMRRRCESADVAVIGMDGRFPGAASVAELWQNLAAGRETISIFSDEELLAAGVDEETLADPHYVKARPILDGVELFDAAFFGYTPREAEIMDPQHRIFLESAWAAFEDAGYDVERYDGPVGVYGGASISSYMANIYSHPELVEAVGTFQTLIGNEKDSLTTKVSYKLNLRGPSLAVQTFCSTSLVAVHLACQALRNGECDMALAGGVSVIVPQKSGYRYEEGGIGSVDGHIRAFDAGGSGIVFGNGLGTVVLKRLDDALADGDSIRAVIRSTAINNDGSGKAGYSATSVEGQAEVVAAALELAGVDPESIGYMEAHGTGTPLGDPIEMAALNRAFRPHTTRKKFCPIGSAKTNVGHLDRAAGVTGLIKTVLALENGVIPPSLHFDEPNPAIDFEDNCFYVVTDRQEWPRGATPRRAGVNSLGLGGTNAHAVLEEAPAIAPSSPGKPWQLLLLSAKTETALERATDNLAAHLLDHPEQPLADVAYTLRIGRKAMRHRRVLVVGDGGHEDAAAAFAGRDPQRLWSAVSGDQAPSVAFLFPGLGGQYAGMARGLYDSEPLFRETVDRAAELLRDDLGLDLREVLLPAAKSEEAAAAPELDLRRMLGRGSRPDDGAASPLDATAVAQPALFVVEYALARLWMSWGVRPRALIGYSLGEYVAACVAGTLSFADALAIVARRARMIQELAAGAMLAVPLAEDEVRPLLGDELSLAAVNGPQQSVVAGPLAAIDELEGRLSGEGVACRRLRTTHAFHSRMMEELYEPFVDFLSAFELRPPEIPWLSNVTGTWMSAEEATDATYWARHMCRPVRFSQSIEELLAAAGSVLLELGPGQTLGSLVLQHPACGRQEKPVALAALRHAYESQADLAHLLTTLGKVWLLGADIAWPDFHDGERRLRVRLPTYSFDRQAYWVENRARGYTGVAELAAAPKRGRRFLYLPSWQRVQAPRPFAPAAGPDPALGHWLVLADEGDGGVGARVAAGLRAAGRAVTVVRPGAGLARIGDGSWTVRPGERADFAALVDELAEPPDAVVHLWSLAVAADDLGTARERGFDSLLGLAGALAGPGRPWKLWLVSSCAYDVSGAETARPAAATALAPIKVLPREVPGVVCRAIDVVPPANGSAVVLADRLLAEIAAGAPEQVVAYRGRHRWVPALVPARLDEAGGGGALRGRGVYLLTGGLSSRGFAFASYLARRVADARLILIEPPLQDAGERQARRLEALRAAGAEVLVLPVDVAEEGALRAALAKVRECYGTLHGIVHAAEPPGVGAAYATIEESSSQAYARAGRALLAARAEGAETLDRLLAEELREPPDFALLVSSLAPFTGGLGLIHEAAASFYVDALAARRAPDHGTRCVPWTSVNWDFWLDDETDGVRNASWSRAGERRTAEGAACSSVPGFVPGAAPPGEERAAALHEAALDDLFRLLPAPQVVVTPRPLEAWNRVEPTVAAAASPTEDGGRGRRDGTSGGLYPRPKLSAPYVAPRTEAERRVAETWESMLGVSPVGVHDGFLELGGDSLLAARLAARLRGAFQLDLPVRIFFEASTVEQLAREIEKAQGENDADLLSQVQELSEDELDRAIAELESLVDDETVEVE